MITQNQKTQIIYLHREQLSNRAIAKELGMNRKTVNKIVNQYEEAALKGEDALDFFISTTPRYNSTPRQKRVLTEEVCKILDEFIAKNGALEEEDNEENTTTKMTAKDMYHQLVEQGHKVGYTTVAQYVKKNSGAIIITHSFAVEYAKKMQKKQTTKKKK